MPGDTFVWQSIQLSANATLVDVASRAKAPAANTALNDFIFPPKVKMVDKIGSYRQSKRKNI